MTLCLHLRRADVPTAGDVVDVAEEPELPSVRAGSAADGANDGQQRTGAVTRRSLKPQVAASLAS